VATEVFVTPARSGRVMAHLLEPPGLGRWFASRAELEAELPGAVEAHLRWLKAKGEDVQVRSPVELHVAEAAAVHGNFESGDDVGTFAPDLQPVSSPEVGRYLRIAGHAHDDLLELASGVPSGLLDREPAPGKRNIRANLTHVARAELWYMTRIIDDPDRAGMPGVIVRADRQIDASDHGAEQVRIAWDAFQEFARSLSEEARARVYVPAWFCAIASERWTVRKALRRCIEHCREHTWVVQRTLNELG
jgi:hypothetical protein